MSKVFILLAHPETDSFNGKIAEILADEYQRLGQSLRRQNLGEMKFNPILKYGYRQIQDLEADLKTFQDNIKWCDKLILIYPRWWGSFPAKLKGLFDRALLPNFAFKYHNDDLFWDKLLQGKQAWLISSSDAPTWYNRIICGDSDFKILKTSILGFCGIKVKKTTRIGRIKYLNHKQRLKALEKIKTNLI